MRLARHILRATVLVLGLGVATFGYTKLMARAGSGTPPTMAEAHEQADEILVIKSTRALHLRRAGKTIRSYDISLGAAPAGHKQSEGDERTPEGRYEIDWRNPNSVAHLSLHISYPNAADQAAANAAARDPGGNIMIHGLPNGWGALGALHLMRDWTDGCIAVTNTEMREIWSLVPNGTPITIVEAL
ncbi:L,D-transpeptidase family protein [Tritonibacter scottomollicae]|uniref:L,D-transpeptidase family protein n=1 Tax=Tritonibacter scottomollicae TaxID=483013 RepID=A0ABZ0HAM3_TRISK|nr:L,D-transpeptidase family protein [Tritonibacter scottomollicae]WOI31840.1 L,D-transpeptidase family protein [Tritonibacter scottomollicae]